MGQKDDIMVGTTHPWIDFRFEVKKLNQEAWIALGECASKCEHIANTPLPPAVFEDLHLLYLSKGVQATTAIEGNTLTEEEVRLAVENALELPPSKEYLAQEVRNILEAINLISKRFEDGIEDIIQLDTLCEYNAMVLCNLDVEDGVSPGKLRDYNVGVGKYQAPKHKEVPRLTERLCEKLNSLNITSTGLNKTILGILKAVFAHLYVAWIHPFGDGNGRTARLLEFDILLRAGVPTPAVHLLSNYYNMTRSEYYRQLDVASRERKAYSFVTYAIVGFRDGLREQLDRINQHVRNVVWVNYVHESFTGRKTEAWRRRRDVVLEVSEQKEPVEIRDIPVLSTRLREYYRKKTERTLHRDVNELLKMFLLKHSVDGKGLVANRGLMDTFLPLRRRTDERDQQQ